MTNRYGGDAVVVAPAAQERAELIVALEAALDAARGLRTDAYDNPPLRHRLTIARDVAEGARCLLAGVLVSNLDPGSKAMGHLTRAAAAHVQSAAGALVEGQETGR